MRGLRRFLVRLRASLTRHRDDARLTAEVEEHLALQTADHMRMGMSPEEARRHAVLKFGGVEAIKDDFRDQHGLLFLESLLQDLRHALRGLRKSPGFSVLAVLTLAIGIAATNTAFTIVNTVLIRDLPFESPDQIVRLGVRRTPDAMPLVSYPEFRDWEQSSRSFTGMAALEQTTMNIGDDEHAPEQVEGT